MNLRLRPYGRLVRIENKIGLGTPDLAYVLRAKGNRAEAGWVELKFLPRWPVRAETPVIISSLTIDQVMWGEAHVREGGRSYLLLQAGRSYVLLKHPDVRKIFERKFRTQDVLERALVYAVGKFPTTAMLAALTARQAPRKVL